MRDAITDGYLAFPCPDHAFGSLVRVEIQGLQNIPASEPVLFVSNHQGHFDSAVLLAYVRKPKAFVASSAGLSSPSSAYGLGSLIRFYLERDNVRQNYTALEKAKEVIEEGRSVVIYRGNHQFRTTNRGIQAGCLQTGLDRSIPIVPVVIDGTWKVMGERMIPFSPPPSS